MNSKFIKHFVIIIICFIIDSTIAYLLPYNYMKTSLTIIPYLGLIAFIRSVDYFEGADLYFFAAICGTYYSIIYANSLPIYILVYELIAFASVYIVKWKELSLIEFEGLSCIYVIINIIVTYIVMYIAGKTSVNIIKLFLIRILPTLGLSLIFGFITYYLYEYFERVKFIEKPMDMFESRKANGL